MLSFLAMIFVIVRKIMFGDPVKGWPSLVCVMLFLGGVQLFSIGVIGEYLSKIFAETKKRPHYIISEASDDVEKVR